MFSPPLPLPRKQKVSLSTAVNYHNHHKTKSNSTEQRLPHPKDLVLTEQLKRQVSQSEAQKPSQKPGVKPQSTETVYRKASDDYFDTDVSYECDFRLPKTHLNPKHRRHNLFPGIRAQPDSEPVEDSVRAKESLSQSSECVVTV